MADIQVKMNSAGVQALLKGPEVEADLRRRVSAIAAAAGPGMIVEVDLGATRWLATVRTGSHEAMRAEATQRTLTRALDAGR